MGACPLTGFKFTPVSFGSAFVLFSIQPSIDFVVELIKPRVYIILLCGSTKKISVENLQIYSFTIKFPTVQICTSPHHI